MIKSVFVSVVAIYVIYVLFSAYFLFFLPVSYQHETSEVEPFSLSEQVHNQDYALLLEDGFESGKVRMQILREAKSSIDFISYSVQKGKTSHLFLSELFEAADRGVQVRVLLDGLFHNLHGDLGELQEAIAAHPNMELRYYEPFHLFKPWSWHNRLHDKLLIIDETYGVIGGRNIGDKYLSQKRPNDYVLDRDVLIYNKHGQQNSSLSEMKTYANELWGHPFTKHEKELNRKKLSKGKVFEQKLKKQLDEAKKQEDPFVLPLSQNWINQAILTEHVSFLHNPITRLNKDPYMWRTFAKLAENAQSEVYVQTPYAIPTKRMVNNVHMKPNINWVMLTNSTKQTPNPIAFSGYLSKKEDMLNSGFSIFEYRGDHSIHAKSFVIDNQLSMVGSFNLDARSSFLNTESAVLIEGTGFANELTEKMNQKSEESDFLTEENAHVVTQRSVKTVFVQALSKLSFLWRIFL